MSLSDAELLAELVRRGVLTRERKEWDDDGFLLNSFAKREVRRGLYEHYDPRPIRYVTDYEDVP